MNFPKLVESIDKSKLWYMASPYSGFHLGIEAAFICACEVAADLLLRGVTVYSPIAHTHPIAIHGAIDPLSHEIWMPFDEVMMRVCDGLIIVCLKGWEQSKGVEMELQSFMQMGKPIFYLEGFPND